MMSNFSIRALNSADYDAWEPLFRGYLQFQQRRFDADNVAQLWQWLMQGEMLALVAVCDGKLVGLAHYREMLSPLFACRAGFLDDLFIDSAYRGQHVAAQLMAELNVIARQKGWPFIRWLTHHNNYRGRAFYDKLTNKTYMTYHMDTTG